VVLVRSLIAMKRQVEFGNREHKIDEGGIL